MARYRNKAILLLAVTTLVASCADYMNRRDSVSQRAGDAVEANSAIQEISPWPPYVERTSPN